MSNICDDLRKSILRAAITGRLTEQLASDAPVKKELDANNILHDDEKEYPFDIPENWAWVKLKAVANVQYGFPFNSQLFNKNEKGMPLIRIRDILPAKTSTYTTEKASENYLIKKNDMLVGMDGNFNVNFWNSEDAYLNQRCCKIAAGPYLEQKLLYWFLPIFLDEIFENVSYTTVRHLSDRHLTKMSIPLPPLAEQKRIVEKVDELMARVADLEQSADALTSLKKAFPNDIKASLLQTAMQGKLTKQSPEDGNAEELLDQIKVEKEKLIAEGKIKKQKLLEPITDDEIPFSIPNNWEWARLGDITYNHGQKKPEKLFSYIDVGTLNNIDHKLNDEEQIVEPEKASSRARKIVHKGDVIYATIRPYLHNICIIDRDFSEEPIASTAFAVMSPFTGVYNRYLFEALLSPCFDNYANRTDLSKGVAYPAIGEKDFFNGIIPLPPLAEQKRIVERLDALMQNINVVGDLIASE